MSKRIDLDAIRARADAATPGPWVADDTEIYAGPGRDWVAETGDFRDKQGKANGAFIAHARQDIPALLTEIDQITAALNVDLLTRAINDPGAFVKRDPSESVGRWSARAVLASLGRAVKS